MQKGMQKQFQCSARAIGNGMQYCALEWQVSDDRHKGDGKGTRTGAGDAARGEHRHV